MNDLITYLYADGVATITMDDGRVNVMSDAMLAALGEALDRAEADRAVVVLTGRDRIFSAGYDIAMFDGSPESIFATMRAGGQLVRRLLAHPFPTIAACRGHAIAQGAFTLLACDVRLGAIGEWKVGLNEVAIGLTIPHYGVELARHQLNAPWFDYATVTGALLDSSTSLAAGFFHEASPAEEVVEIALARARTLATLDMDAHAGTKLRTRRAVLEAIDRYHPAEFDVAALAALDNR